MRQGRVSGVTCCFPLSFRKQYLPSRNQGILRDFPSPRRRSEVTPRSQGRDCGCIWAVRLTTCVQAPGASGEQGHAAGRGGPGGLQGVMPGNWDLGFFPKCHILDSMSSQPTLVFPRVNQNSLLSPRNLRARAHLEWNPLSFSLAQGNIPSRIPESHQLRYFGT